MTLCVSSELACIFTLKCSTLNHEMLVLKVLDAGNSPDLNEMHNVACVRTVQLADNVDFAKTMCVLMLSTFD